MITLENLTLDQVKAHLPHLMFDYVGTKISLNGDTERLRAMHGVELGQILVTPSGQKIFVIGACEAFLWLKFPNKPFIIKKNSFCEPNQTITITSEIIPLKELIANIFSVSNYAEYIQSLNLPPLKASDYSFSKTMIGNGEFCKVYEGVINQEKVACKKLKLKSQALSRELRNLQLITENIPINDVLVKFKGYANSNPEILFFEYMNDGTLFNFIHNDGKYNLDLCLPFIRSIAEALALLHHHIGLIHRDVKAENVFLNKENNTLVAKLGDFGLSITETETKTADDVSGSPVYLAPELILSILDPSSNQVGYSVKSDIFALGIIICELLTRKELYAEIPTEALLFKAVAIDKQLPSINLTNNSKPSELKMASLFKRCCLFDPSQRPNASEVVTELVTELVIPAQAGTHPRH